MRGFADPPGRVPLNRLQNSLRCRQAFGEHRLRLLPLRFGCCTLDSAADDTCWQTSSCTGRQSSNGAHQPEILQCLLHQIVVCSLCRRRSKLTSRAGTRARCTRAAMTRTWPCSSEVLHPCHPDLRPVSECERQHHARIIGFSLNEEGLEAAHASSIDRVCLSCGGVCCGSTGRGSYGLTRLPRSGEDPEATGG